jgi:uncharacterized protein YjiS (DUF1127 family)
MSTAICEHNVSTSFASDRAPGPRLGGFGNIVAVVARWSERAAQRRRLRQLDDRLLHDMGLSRADVEQEASKPFWRT